MPRGWNPGLEYGLLICAVAERHDLSIFTTDQEFVRYKRYCLILPHEPSKEK